MFKIVPVQLQFGGIVNRMSIHIPITLNQTKANAHITLQGAGMNTQSFMLEIPEDIYSQWGTEDTFILDYILTELGFELDETPDEVVNPAPQPTPIDETPEEN